MVSLFLYVPQFSAPLPAESLVTLTLMIESKAVQLSLKRNLISFFPAYVCAAAVSRLYFQIRLLFFSRPFFFSLGYEFFINYQARGA